MRLDTICSYIQRGKSPKYSPDKKYPVISQKCVQWSGFSITKAQFIDPKTLNSYASERILQNCDLLWNSTGLGTIGRIAVYYSNLNPYELAVADSHVTVIRASTCISPEYLYYYFSNPSVQDIIEEQADGSTNQKELSLTTVKNYIVPLPPIQEQYRIAQKVEEILSRIEECRSAHERYTSILSKSPGNLRERLIQAAIQGKLVPQDKNDEPASTLLERIAKERAAKLGKKAAKSMSRIERRGRETYEIFPDGSEKDITKEIPFDIPDSWEWVRLGCISLTMQYGTAKKSLSHGKYIVYRMGNIVDRELVNNNLAYSNDEQDMQKLSLAPRDILFNRTNSIEHVGKTALYRGSPKPAIFAGYLIRIKCYINCEFLNYLLNSLYARHLGQKVASLAINQANISADKLKRYIIPLPPLQEQHRIVERLDALLKLVDVTK